MTLISRPVRLLAMLGLTMLVVAGDASATPPCVPAGNPIVAENAKPGNSRSEWDLDGRDNGAPKVQGFATPISINRGGTVSFKIRIQAQNPTYTIDIYRMGYYGDDGARKVKTISSGTTAAPAQPACSYDATTGLVDCSNWSVTAAWNGIETNEDIAPSGIYIAKVSSPGLGASHMIFVVRDDGGCADLLFQTSDTTWQAYNNFTDLPNGNTTLKISLYQNEGGPTQPPQTPTRFRPLRAYKVSYNRPFTSRDPTSTLGVHSWFFYAEYPMVRWLEQNGYNVSYFTGVDTDRDGAELLLHKVFVTAGHDEYWSAAQRANVEAARGAGVHLAFFAGNNVFWKVRWENNRQTMVCYKETHADDKIDPLPQVWTGLWRDARFGPHDGGRPENALLGNLYMTNILGSCPRLTVSSDDGELRFWRNTAARDLDTGAPPVELADGTLGFEYNTDDDNGFRPQGLVRLSTTPGVPGLLLSPPDDYDPGSLPHHITLYRHAGGALVFSAGTIQWSWGLDCVHDVYTGKDDLGNPVRCGDNCALYNASNEEQEKFRTVRQATANLFLDMNVTPGTPASDLNWDPLPPDVTPPSSAITSPAANTTFLRGTPIVVSGTASDSGGLVAAVEVSDDGGTRWHYATGRTSWSYTWKPQSGATPVRSRAIDDSANQEVPGAGVTLYVVHAVPGEIEAEDFDRGGEGTGYHELTPGNPGNSPYRPDDVEITQCPPQTQCNLIVGYVQTGEWLQYTMQVPATGLYTIGVRGTNGSGGQFRIEVDGVDKTGSLPVPATGDNWVVGTSWKAGVSLTAGRHVLRLFMVANGTHGWVGNFDSIQVSRAYSGTPFAIPGAFGAEEFDQGGERVAYHDLTPTNDSTTPSTLRQDTGVDLSVCPAGTHCGIIVSYVQGEEWLLYSIDVAAAATYDILVEGTNGIAGGVFHVEIDGVDKTGPLSIPVTGDNWVVGTARKLGVSLAAGPHALRIVVDQAPPVGFIGNFDGVRIVRRPFVVPGPAIEAEDFDSAYDTTPGNSGSGLYYRTSDVDLTVCPAGSQCRVIVSFVKATEWLQYSINVATAGVYKIEVQGTNGSTGGSFHIEIDGINVSGPLAVPNTGDNWIVGTVTTGSISMSAGPHVARIVMDQEAVHTWVGNFDRIRFIQQ